MDWGWPIYSLHAARLLEIGRRNLKFWMSLSNLIFFHIFIHMSHTLHIFMSNLLVAMDKEDCGVIDD
jgi:hypothetical protein